ncbi:MAG: GlsB/YeaQ/YmgE family stress response membrane protein [Myxococcaceae bacterium]
MSIIAWIVIGLLAGLIARALVPGPQPMGFIATTLLGIVGSVVGGLVGAAIWQRNAGEFSPGGLVLSILGAIAVLLIWGAVTRRGATRRPVRP